MRKIGRLFVAAVLLAPSLEAQAAAPRSEAAVPVLSVLGSGEARVAPDEATVRLGVLVQDPSARGAQEKVNVAANAILEAVRKLGVRPEQIQTSDLSLNPVYSQPQQQRPDQPYEPRITGYQASNVVSVRLTDLALVGRVVDAGLGAGANRLEGVVFGLRDDAAARSTALTRAAETARAKAETLARSLRVRLVELVEVSEGGVQVFTPLRQMRGAAMESMAMDAGTPVSAGEVGVDASVTLRYRIEPCPGQGPCS